MAIFLTLATSLASAGEIEAIREASSQILRERPPEKYLYIGIGRSPTPIIAYLQAIAGEKSASQMAYSRAALNEQAAARSPREMDAYLEEVLGPLIRRAHGRRFLFVDYVVNGGFRSALRVIDSFLARRHPSVRYDFMALIGGESLIRNLDWLKRENLIRLDSLDVELERKIRASQYDSVSPVGAWHLGDPAPGLPGENHRDYQSKMRTQVSHDPSYPSFVGIRCSNLFVE